MRTEEHQTPFYHVIVDDFLSEEHAERLRAIYSRQAFSEVYTDLYRFLQTGELAHLDELEFFKERLDCVLGEHYPLDRRYYNIFGSFFRAGDGLLCHDDLIGSRVFAFAYYLEDFCDGEFLMYERDCETLGNRIAVRRNRLVFFRVGEYSFHEVAKCRVEGRMALAGWFNATDVRAPSSTTRSALHVPEGVEYYELPLPLPGPGEIQCAPFEDVESPVRSVRLVGPFIYRRYTRIEHEVLHVPRLAGHELVHAECLVVDEEGYILCNDAVNDVVDGVVDIYVFGRGAEAVPNFVMYIGTSGEKSFALDAVPGHMLVAPREGHNLCVMRADRRVEFKHFIYRRTGDGAAPGRSQ